jgi:hypothetical protein
MINIPPMLELVKLLVPLEPPAPVAELVVFALPVPGVDLSSPLHATNQVLKMVAHAPAAN